MTYLAEVDKYGNLYACGSVNLIIGLIFLAAMVLPFAGGFLTFRVSRESDFAPILAVAVGFILVLISGVGGWLLSAMLAVGSCS